VELIYDRYHALIELKTWLPFFPKFTEIFRAYGSPFPDLVALIDRKFLRVCRPGGLGNKRSRLDQGHFYTGEKSAHGLKHMTAFMPHGMIALAGPFLGSVADGRMIAESGWIPLMRQVCMQDNRRYCLFGDAAFAVTNFIQSMLKGEASIRADGRAFNALMSRIRINIERPSATRVIFLPFLPSIVASG
jgi:hypothetical protein